MTENPEAQYLRRVIALLRLTLGIIILATWFDNLNKGIYTADGITGLFNYIFNDNGGGPVFYQAIIEGTILQAPGTFATFQMVAEFLMGLALLLGFLTPVAGAGAVLFFSNLLLAYFGGNEWIWVYVLLAASALVITLARSGRAFGIDQILMAKRGQPPLGILW